MRIPLLCAAIVLAAAACDPRYDDADRTDTGTTPAPVDGTTPATTTPEPVTTPPPTDPTLERPGQGVPPGTVPCAENDPNCVDPGRDPTSDPATTPPPTEPVR